MATLVFSALGTLIGGPLGGSIGAMIGNQVDRTVFGSGKREGPRLKDLAVTTSSYGAPIPRHFGQVRSAGSIIWATDLQESSQAGGGKGQPSVRQYSYTISFAVALASRPIRRLGRIWADGNLLRGAAGDLKTGGILRIYDGTGDQPVDPLIASDKGADCPAFRGLAYCVFESLQLSDFGNRVPALTFEIVADDGAVSLQQLVGSLADPDSVNRPLADLAGYSDIGGPVASLVSSIDQVYPIGCDCSGAGLSLFASDAAPDNDPPTLPMPASDMSGETFGKAAGEQFRRLADQRTAPAGLRYYDLDRDFQPGLQRAEGRARPGREDIIEFPGALSAPVARDLANAAAERVGWSREVLSWRLAELDPALKPGDIVRLPTRHGLWRIAAWEWRNAGVELELHRLPFARRRPAVADAGSAVTAPDLAGGPTVLAAFDLPSDAGSNPDVRRVFAAVSSEAAGWSGAALHAVGTGGTLEALGPSGPVRCAVGRTLGTLPPSPSLVIESDAEIDIALPADLGGLAAADARGIAEGANRALIGEEIVQFAHCTALGNGHWRLTCLLRGRGGTEHAAQTGAPAGVPFVLLDQRLVPLDTDRMGNAAAVAGIGLSDPEPVVAQIANPRIGLVPLTPVHGQVTRIAGALHLAWCRRCRGAWNWPDGIDAPLGEQAERYLVGIGEPDQPMLYWETGEPRLVIDAGAAAQLIADHPGKALWVRQIGTHAMSRPLHLAVLA